MRLKHLFIVAILYINALYTKPWHASIEASAGPAWQSFFLYKTFTLKPGLFVGEPQAEKMAIHSIFMPFVAAAGTITIAEKITAGLSLGTGTGYKAPTTFMPSTELVNGLYEKGSLGMISRLHASIIDGNIGFRMPIAKLLCINPILGYTRTQQIIDARFVLDDAMGIFFTNRWHGAYAGLIVILPCTSFVTIAGSYKYVAGEVDARTTVHETLTKLPNDPFSCATLPMTGSIASIRLSYAYGCWDLGGQVFYYRYQNSKPATIYLKNNIGQTEHTQEIAWQQTIVQIFAQYNF